MKDLPPAEGDHPREPVAGEAPFLLAEELAEGLPLLHLGGEVDLAAAPAIRDRLTALVQQLGVGREAPDAVVLDLGRVTFIDSTGLSMLVAAHSRFGESGKELRVAAVPPRVRRVLELTGLDGLLSTYDDVPSALRGSGSS